MNTETLRQKLRHCMREQELTQEHVSRLAHVSQSSISRFLNGKTISLGPALRLLEYVHSASAGDVKG